MVKGVGVYISVPFCKAKCTFCNFRSGVFPAGQMSAYVGRLCEEMRQARIYALSQGAEIPPQVDSIYFGGGTPSLLPPLLVHKIFAGLRAGFEIDPAAEITVECAPGQLDGPTLEALQREGLNRLSYGVQSFVDRECSTVGRLHTGQECRDALRSAAAAGVKRIGIDLIVGLPHQTEQSWAYSIDQALESEVEHASVYMLEVDDGSRLGKESIAGGSRYGAAALPVEDHVADWYQQGAQRLSAAGVAQYEISNFARDGGESQHNRKYWERTPYLGFGMDAHSMLRIGPGGVRWANAGSMSAYMDRLGHWERKVDRVDSRAGFEEDLFLGLRLLEGVDLRTLDSSYLSELDTQLKELREAELIILQEDRLKLTDRGRIVSNEVFERLLVSAVN